MATCPVCGNEHDDAASCADQPETSRVGQVICDKYRVIRLIGEGGMASVYEARHTTINRPFALKFLHPWLSRDEEWLERFRREASAGGSLVSEHITSILDAGVTNDGAPYILMELLRGEDLGQRLSREGTLKPHEAIDIIGQACHGLAIAHRAGVIHRDLKPENLFLCDRELGGDLVKVLDFGIAKLKNASLTNATKAGMVMGTPYYMSPEQAAGRGGVDHRTDLYALGVMLFELLSGEKPYQADDQGSVLNRIVSGPTPRLMDVCPMLSSDLSEVVQRAIAKQPEDRFQTAEELSEALLRFWPPGRRGARTAGAIASMRARRPTEDMAYQTSAEPRVTVRVTGSREGKLSPVGARITSAPPSATPVSAPMHSAPIRASRPIVVGDTSSPPSADHGEAQETDEFGDHTEPDALLLLDAQLRDDAEAASDVDASRSPQTRGAPRKPKAPSVAPRQREHAGVYPAADVEDGASEPPGVHTSSIDDDTPVPTSIQTVSLGRTLAPLMTGIIAVVVVVFLAVHHGGSSRPSHPVAAKEATSAHPTTEAGATPSHHETAPTSDPSESAKTEGLASVEVSDDPVPPLLDEGTAPENAVESAAQPEGSGEVTMGWLNVESVPPARLSIDGDFKGTTPKLGLQLPVGDYKLWLTHPDHGARARNVKVLDGGFTSIKVNFGEVDAKEDEPVEAAKAAPRTAANCTPEWKVDAQGVRRVKPECLP